jgi:hypothetical protein
MKINVGTLYTHPASDIDLRIVHTDLERALLFFIRIFPGPKTKYGIEFSSIDTFKKDYEGWVPIKEKYLKDKPEDEISPTDKLKRDQRYDIIRSAVESTEFLFPRKRRDIIRDILKSEKKKKKAYQEKKDDSLPKDFFGRSTIWEWIMYWFIGGMSRNSLVTNYENSGGPGIIREPLKDKRGRPRKVYSKNEINVNSSVRAIMERSVKRYYGKKPESSLLDAYYEMIAFEFIDTPKIPSYNQFRDYYYYGNLREEIEKERAGEVVYEKDKRTLSGTVRDRTFGIGSEFQFDNTKDDTHAIAIEIGNAYIGRLTLYLVVDVFSGMIVGVSLTPENASYRAGCLALENAGSDKVAFCRSLGIEEEEMKYEDWPCDGLCQMLRGDKGELFSHKADSITNNLKINVELTPSKRPDLKSLVERAIGTFMKELKKVLYKHGLVNKGTRVEKDTSKEAVLNMNDILYIIVKEILHYNKYQDLKDYPLTEEMVAAKVRRTPLGIWTWAAANGLSSLNHFEQDVLARNLLEQHSDVSYYEDGFYFSTKFWVPTTEPGKRVWKNLLANKPCKATISFDPLFIEKTYLYHNRNFYPLRLRQHQLPFKSHIEMNATLEEFDVQDKSRVDEKTQHKAQTIRDQHKKVGEAVARQAGLKRTVNRKNTRQNREKAKESHRETLRNQKLKATKTPAPISKIKSGLPSRLKILKKLS